MLWKYVTDDQVLETCSCYGILPSVCDVFHIINQMKKNLHMMSFLQ